MTPAEHEPLLRQLLELVKELDAEDIPIILGGGMSLYLRQRYLSSRTPRYPFDIAARSTADLDLFLSAQLIADAGMIENLKHVIARLKYSVIPEARNFQFAKEIDLFGQKRKVKIDLLCAPPHAQDKRKVQISKPRIKPKGVEDFHAYLTTEAEGLEIGALAVDVSRIDSSLKLRNQVLRIPSAFDFLILKLHAFEDRKDDTESDLGRHHAYDIFATVARMGEGDWENARRHLTAHKDRPYLKRAVSIREKEFSTPSSLGLLRLRENESYRSNRETYDRHLDPFIEDLSALFPS
jgi:hypothetical protein